MTEPKQAREGTMVLKVKLKVLSGSNAGKSLSVRKRKFIIGRADDCQLRVRNDALSRRHCVLITTEELVFVRDLKSRNGTQVNGKTIQKDKRLRSGDRLSLGPLEFELVITSSSKRTPAARPDDLILQTPKSKSMVDHAQLDDGDVGAWLDEADDLDSAARVTRSSETRIFHLAEKGREELKKAAEAQKKQSGKVASSSKGTAATNGPVASSVKSGLSPAENSSDAASEMLRKMFNRR